MKRFSFPLEGLLRVRKVDADQRRGDLQRSIARLLEVEQQLDLLANERQQGFQSLRQLVAGRLPMVQVRAHQGYLNQLNRREVELAKQQQSEQQRFREAHLSHAEARRRQQVVERLRERRLDEYHEEARRASDAELDETNRLLGMARRAEGGV